MVHQSECISSCQQALKSPVTLDAPQALVCFRESDLTGPVVRWRVRILQKEIPGCKNTLQTKKLSLPDASSAYKRCFTFNAGSGPKSTSQYVLLALCLSIQTTAENTQGIRWRAKTCFAAPFLVTWNHGLILSRRTGLYPLLSNIICLTKGSASKHLSETRAQSLWEPFSCR